MKQRLQLIVWMLMAQIAAWAQTWTAPVDPASSGADVVDGGTYFIKNVGCGQYMVGANSWATQISVSADFTPYFSVVTEAASAYNDGVEVRGYKLRMNGTFYFTGDHNRVDFPVSDTYLFRDSEGSGFVDLGGQSRNAIWILTKDNNGYYRIQSTTENGLFPNAATQYAYAKNAGQAVEFNRTEGNVGSANIAYLEWQFIPTNVSTEDIALYGARKALYDALLEAYELGADYAEASEVYENSNNTNVITSAANLLIARNNLFRWIQEAKTYNVECSAAEATYAGSTDVATLNAEANALKQPVNFAKMLVEISHSSIENPLDITDAVMVNADFDAGNTNGWEVTQTMGQNLGYQSAGYTNGNINISKFIEAWYPTNVGPLKDGVIAQTITGLPEGHYRLECDGIAVWQDDASLEVTGVYLFYDNGSIVYKSPSSLNTENGKPEHLTFEFDYDGSAQMKIGLMTAETNANWLAADNFKLYAIGPMLVPPSFTALQNALPAYEAINLDQKAYSGDITRLSDAIAAAQNLVNAGADNTKTALYTAAAQELEQAVAAFRASAAAYETFLSFIQNKKNAVYPTNDIYNVVNAQLTAYQTIYDDQNCTIAQLEQAMNSFDAILLRIALATRENDLVEMDLTDYLESMWFDYTTEQIHYPSTPVAWKNETATTAFCTAYETAEVWDQPSFNIYREISNMPAGDYRLTVQALFREGGNQYNYDNYMSGNLTGVAQFYAGTASASIPNMAEVAMDWGTDGWVNVGINPETGDEVYVPNNQEQANYVFRGEYNSDTATKTLISLDVSVSEGETLRFGIRGDNLQGGAWVVWKDFRIYAKGTDNPALVTLVNTIQQAERKGYDEQTKAEKTTRTAFLTTLAEAKEMAAARQNTNDEYAAEVNKLNAALSDLEASVALYSELQDLMAEAQQVYEALQNSSFPAATNAVSNFKNELANAYDEGTATADQIASWQGVALSLARQNMSWEDIQKGTDLSFLIKNADFNRGQYGRTADNGEYEFNGTDKSIPGWTVRSGNITELSGAFHNIEIYHKSCDFYQVIPDIPAGIYEISVQGFVRVDSGDNDMELYAGISHRTFKEQTDEYSTICLFSDGSVDNDGNPSSTPNNWPYDYPHTDLTEDGSMVYVPHSMEGANIYFNAQNPATGLPFYTNIVKITHTGGDLTIGVRCSNRDLWILWDNFRLAYAGGLAQDELIEELMADIKAAAAPIESVQQALDDAYAAGERVLGTDFETQEPVIEQMRKALADAAEATSQLELYKQAFAAYSAWEEAETWDGWERYTTLAEGGKFTTLDEVKAAVTAINGLAIQQLGTNISQAQELASEKMYVGVKQTLATAANTSAAALQSTSCTEIDEAHALLAEAIRAARASMEDYQRLADYMNQAQRIAVVYDSMLNDEVKAVIAEKIASMQQAYNKEVVTGDDIDAIWEDLQQTTRENLMTSLQPLQQQAAELQTHNLSDELHANLATAQTEVLEIFEMEEFTADNAPDVKVKFDALLNAVNEASAYVAWLDNLTDELPVGKELTALIVNPNFTLGEQGWTVDNMFQEGGATEGCVIGTTYTNGDITIDKFAETWRSSRAVDDASISQVLKDLPAGAYALEADVITAAYGNETNLVGVHLFAQSEQRLTTMLCRTDYDQPQHRRLLVNHEGGDLTIGVSIKNANANWVAMDNFKLFVAAAPDAGDIAILQLAHEQMGGSEEWIEPWELDVNPFSPAGVIFKDGHVSEIDLSGYGVTGQFPTALLTLPQLQQLNLSGNSLQGNLTEALQEMAEQGKTNNSLRILNISNNALSGNVGLLGTVCPQLQTLLAQKNQLDACTPALPQTLATLNLESQTLSGVWDYDLSSPTHSAQNAPSILGYVHGTDGTEAATLTGALEDWQLAIRTNGSEVTFEPSTELPYRGENGHVFSLIAQNGAAAGSSTMMRLAFQPGDADFSGWVNVADLQTSIRYMFADWQNKAFNYTAANLYEDQRINVQDVVKLVDVLLEDPSQGVKKALRARADINNGHEEAPEAVLFWRDNTLVLQTEIPVAAADICIEAAGEINWNVPQWGFTVAQRNAAGRVRTILYSLSDAELPVGETILATFQGTQPRMEEALLTNRDAELINTSIRQSLPTAIHELDIVSDDWMLTTADGKILAQGSGTLQWQEARRRLTVGVYLLTNSRHQFSKVIIK